MNPPAKRKSRFLRWKSATLIQAALTSPDEERRWQYVVELHWRGDRATLDAAKALCQSASTAERRLGADILGQLGVPDRTFPGEAVKILRAMSRRETSTQVLQAVLVALGHTLDAGTRAPFAFFKGALSHKRSAVRWSLAFALMGREEPASIRMLIRLSRDRAADVRDWATFCLGTQTELDTPAIRRALWERVTDRHADTRDEALVGLARRKDTRILPVLAAALGKKPRQLDLEAAAQLCDPRLLPRLRELHAKAKDETDTNGQWLSSLESAIEDLSKPSLPLGDV